jgi:hypothetical protein
MGLLTTIDNSLSGKAKSFIDSGSLLTSGRFIAFVALISLAIFKILDPAVLNLALWAFVVYTAGNTITRTAQIVMDGLVHKTIQENVPAAPVTPPAP